MTSMKAKLTRPSSTGDRLNSHPSIRGTGTDPAPMNTSAAVPKNSEADLCVIELIIVLAPHDMRRHSVLSTGSHWNNDGRAVGSGVSDVGF